MKNQPSNAVISRSAISIDIKLRSVHMQSTKFISNKSLTRASLAHQDQSSTSLSIIKSRQQMIIKSSSLPDAKRQKGKKN